MAHDVAREIVKLSQSLFGYIDATFWVYTNSHCTILVPRKRIIQDEVPFALLKRLYPGMRRETHTFNLYGPNEGNEYVREIEFWRF